MKNALTRIAIYRCRRWRWRQTNVGMVRAYQLGMTSWHHVCDIEKKSSSAGSKA